jgi:hypothetical protein
MKAHLLIDNWTLQHVAELLAQGFDEDTAHDMDFSKNGRRFKYKEIPENLLKIECLFQLLNGIVFADELMVDNKFVSAWEAGQELSSLRQEGIIVGKPFYDLAEKWIPAREIIARELCFCSMVRRVHDANVKQYGRDKTFADQLLSQIVWGGAGYLARSNFFQIPYLPYPLREKLFVKAAFLPGPTPVHEQLQKFIGGERVKLFKKVDASGYFAMLNLPPAAVTIIQESSGPDDLIKVAVQYRQEFREVRRWIAEFQSALSTEDVKEIASRRKVFESVAKHVDAITSLSPEGQTSLQFGLSSLKVVTKSGDPVNSIKNLFGVRSAMNRLILAPPGQKAFRKLVGFFGENVSNGARDLERMFLAR